MRRTIEILAIPILVLALLEIGRIVSDPPPSALAAELGQTGPQAVDCNNPATFLFATLQSNPPGGPVSFQITNSSAACTALVGVASYLLPTGNPFNPPNQVPQVFFAGSTTNIGPGQVITLSVAVPGCAFQAEAFFGPLTTAPGPTELPYTGRVLQSVVGGTGLCTPTPTATATFTTTLTPTVTQTPTATATPSATVSPSVSTTAVSVTPTGSTTVSPTTTRTVTQTVVSPTPTSTPIGGIPTPTTIIFVGGGPPVVPGPPFIPGLVMFLISGNPGAPWGPNVAPPPVAAQPPLPPPPAPPASPTPTTQVAVTPPPPPTAAPPIAQAPAPPPPVAAPPPAVEIPAPAAAPQQVPVAAPQQVPVPAPQQVPGRAPAAVSNQPLANMVRTLPATGEADPTPLVGALALLSAGGLWLRSRGRRQD